MGTEFSKCPNCSRTLGGMVFGNLHIYECRQCDKLFCDKCGDGRCPNCGSKDKRDAGYVKS